MHELTLVKDVVKALEEEVKKEDIKKVKTIYLEVGELQHLDGDIINSSYRHTPKSEKLEGAYIKVSIIPGNEFKVKSIEW